ncbi:DUF695 domain-containing protein [Chitinophaga rhizophila]|uniref:DUF695 domain-containing protein n=1 Tax=Chitinophaga rhizophila TaxID=2866212 RepID=A0ABS7GLD0_9BACT|nr:DUF695 domain-containing protein [Chitinophaga rhizophila]MBW8688141.1 DUF695 domain-containing protein [Chitinophaga rhizophila]
MNFIPYLFLFTIAIVPLWAEAQSGKKSAEQTKEPVFNVYMARYEDGDGSTIFNEDLKAVAPVSSQPFVIITGVKFKDCANGFPTHAEFDRLYVISDSVRAIIDPRGDNSLAGTFTYQCERLDYYYASDTVNLRHQLLNLYARSFSNYESYVNIKVDKDWDAYLRFLYPNETIREYMRNEQVIRNLTESGDKLDKARRVDHWIYFLREEDRQQFEAYATKLGFSIGEKANNKDDQERPLGLRIHRIDKVDLDTISKLTLELRQKASAHNGDYDGWETEVVK